MGAGVGKLARTSPVDAVPRIDSAAAHELASAPSSSQLVLGTVCGRIRKLKSKRGRPILAFTLDVDDPGPFGRRILAVTVRGKQAEQLAPVIVDGVRLRLTGKVRTVTYLKVEKAGPELEVWRVRPK